jgi:hypothetical protein
MVHWGNSCRLGGTIRLSDRARQFGLEPCQPIPQNLTYLGHPFFWRHIIGMWSARRPSPIRLRLIDMPVGKEILYQ